MMGTEWAAADVTLPRWVVWTALLTSPAMWSRRAAKMLRKRLGGGGGE